MRLPLLLLHLAWLFSLTSSAQTTEEEGLAFKHVAGPKKGKVLSLFSVVTFKNTGCTSSSNLNGTCYTASECTNKGGTATGNCASGFGVCCVFTVSAAAGTVTQNCTYVQNPGYPSVYTGSSLTYTVNKCSSDVCWLRLDFVTFTLAGPTDTLETSGGQCSDQFQFQTTSSTSPSIPIICGQNDGQHMYMDVGGSSTAPATLAFTFGTTTSVSRKWQIKVTQVPCASPVSPPNGCLQYYYSSSGRIKTFNFQDSTSTHLASQKYSICIRPDTGMCCVQYQVCAGETNAYSLDKPTGVISALVDNSCIKDYTEIIGSSACSGGSDLHSRYCGVYFSVDTTSVDNIPICDCTQPFTLSFVTDTSADATPTLSLSRGNCFDFRQIPCGTTGAANS